MLEQLLRRQTSTQRLVRRIKIVLGAGAGLNNSQLTQQFKINRITVNNWRQCWYEHYERLLAAETNQVEDKDLTKLIEAVLNDAPRSGTPTTFTPEQIVQITALACENPQTSDRPVSHWVAEDVADEAVKRKIVELISPRSIRRFFKRGRLTAAKNPLLAQRLSR